MELLIIISTPSSTPIALGLARAANRAGIKWAVFFTNDGVNILQRPDVAEAMAGATTAVACQESWQSFMGDLPCPVQLGSQTNNSLLVSQTRRIISL